jgi:hypothetical protein
VLCDNIMAALEAEGAAFGAGACGALWPAPECGWTGRCANGTCVCEGGWVINDFAVERVVLCTRWPALNPALYWFSFASFGGVVLMLWCMELLEWRHRGLAHALSMRRTYIMAISVLPLGMLLFYLAANGHELVSTRPISVVWWGLVMVYDSLQSAELYRFVRALSRCLRYNYALTP